MLDGRNFLAVLEGEHPPLGSAIARHRADWEAHEQLHIFLDLEFIPEVRRAIGIGDDPAMKSLGGFIELMAASPNDYVRDLYEVTVLAGLHELLSKSELSAMLPHLGSTTVRRLESY